ncbi:MAG: hypothetical protein KatS3mg087_0438 [Patescibacteria group bacterium]|nr:MAG: hypothetical protein KatS3mg087_0438 [Patescibacteria group bacterium]
MANNGSSFKKRRTFYTVDTSQEAYINAEPFLRDSKKSALLLRGLEYYRSTVNSFFDALVQDDTVMDTVKSFQTKVEPKETQILSWIRSDVDDFVNNRTYEEYYNLVQAYYSKSYPFDVFSITPKKVAHGDSDEFLIMRDWLTCALARGRFTAEKMLRTMVGRREFDLKRAETVEGEYLVPHSLFYVVVNHDEESVQVNLLHNYTPRISATFVGHDIYSDIVTLHELCGRLFSVSLPPIRLVVERAVFSDDLVLDDLAAKIRISIQSSFLRHVSYQHRNEFRIVNKNKKQKPFYKPKYVDTFEVAATVFRPSRGVKRVGE